MQSFTKEWLIDGQILCYRFIHIDGETADAWYHDAADVLRSWPEESPLNTLLDIRMHGRIIPPVAFSRSRQISFMRPEVQGRTAVLIASALAAKVVSALINTKLATGTRARMIFNDEALALAWLSQFTGVPADTDVLSSTP